MPRLSARAKRRVLARVIEANKRAEARYVKALRAIVRQFHEEAMRLLLPKVPLLAKKVDARTPLSGDFELLQAKSAARIPSQVGEAFDVTARAVKESNAKAMRIAGVSTIGDARVQASIAARRDENIRLVERAERAYADSVREIFEDPDAITRTTEDLVEDLLSRGDISESRAELIARDQTLKMNGEINQIRQENAGIDSYVWSTSLDERVRDEHAILEGETFSWDSPPAVGHPGEDFQCRCVAIPVIEGLEDL